MHRAFLKAGAARVVLTVRPDFERDFVSLLETGGFGDLPPTHPYMTIIEEMEAYAMTNFPGIPPADSEGTNMQEEGLLIGTWHEYTPTSALDATTAPMPNLLMCMHSAPRGRMSRQPALLMAMPTAARQLRDIRMNKKSQQRLHLR
jgi:hypothetical protein